LEEDIFRIYDVDNSGTIEFKVRIVLVTPDKVRIVLVTPDKVRIVLVTLDNLTL